MDSYAFISTFPVSRVKFKNVKKKFRIFDPRTIDMVNRFNSRHWVIWYHHWVCHYLGPRYELPCIIIKWNINKQYRFNSRRCIIWYHHWVCHHLVPRYEYPESSSKGILISNMTSIHDKGSYDIIIGFVIILVQDMNFLVSSSNGILISNIALIPGDESIDIIIQSVND